MWGYKFDLQQTSRQSEYIPVSINNSKEKRNTRYFLIKKLYKYCQTGFKLRYAWLKTLFVLLSAILYYLSKCHLSSCSVSLWSNFWIFNLWDGDIPLPILLLIPAFLHKAVALIKWHEWIKDPNKHMDHYQCIPDWPFWWSLEILPRFFII